ncbi:MAG: hypothetical protein LC650_02270 [Actinobacteria bacterium]|nr:hypothetical protein [Actinomycetota bacterium]
MYTETQEQEGKKMTDWNRVELREGKPFDIELSWAHEDQSIQDAFDGAEVDVDDMIDRCNRFVDTHYIARVRALFDGKEFGSAYLGSCYAYDCSPEEDMTENNDNGYLDHLIEDAVNEAVDAGLRLQKEMAQMA